MSVRWLYARHGGKYEDEAESVEDAVAFLRGGNEHGECFPLGVYDPNTDTVFVPHEEPIGVTGPGYRLEEIRSLCGLPVSHEFARVKTFELWPNGEGEG